MQILPKYIQILPNTKTPSKTAKDLLYFAKEAKFRKIWSHLLACRRKYRWLYATEDMMI